MTVLYLNRKEVGLPPNATNSDGTLRPFVTTPASWLTPHYTGNPTPLHTATIEAAKKALLDLERWARYTRKPPTPDEYNFVLFNVAGKTVVCEYAGFRKGAHSAGENDAAFGVLFWLGVGQPCPDSMVEGYRWVRDVHLASRLGLNTKQTPHKDMPSAATPCPGPAVMGRWSELMLPFVPEPTPIPDPGPIDLEDEDVEPEVWISNDANQSKSILYVGGGKCYEFASVPARDALMDPTKTQPPYVPRRVPVGLIDAVYANGHGVLGKIS
jgi:hypothetical protein